MPELPKQLETEIRFDIREALEEGTHPKKIRKILLNKNYPKELADRLILSQLPKFEETKKLPVPEQNKHSHLLILIIILIILLAALIYIIPKFI